MKGNGPPRQFSGRPAPCLPGGPARRKYKKTGRVVKYVWVKEERRSRPRLVSTGTLTGRTRNRIKHGWR